jgi:hypothetical protein
VTNHGFVEKDCRKNASHDNSSDSGGGERDSVHRGEFSLTELVVGRYLKSSDKAPTCMF